MVREKLGIRRDREIEQRPTVKSEGWMDGCQGLTRVWVKGKAKIS